QVGAGHGAHTRRGSSGLRRSHPARGAARAAVVADRPAPRGDRHLARARLLPALPDLVRGRRLLLDHDAGRRTGGRLHLLPPSAADLAPPPPGLATGLPARPRRGDRGGLLLRLGSGGWTRLPRRRTRAGP